MKPLALWAAAGFSVLLAACGNDANVSQDGLTSVGAEPVLPAQQRGLIP